MGDEMTNADLLKMSNTPFYLSYRPYCLFKSRPF